MKAQQLFSIVKNTAIKHSPEILVGFGLAGMVATTVLAVKATPKALRLIEEKQKGQEETLTKVDVVKTTWTCYIPAAITCVVSAGCILGASSINAKKNAAIAAAYSISERAFSEYKEQVVEVIGEKKEQLVRDKVAEKQLKEYPKTNREVIMTDKGDMMCFDPISGRTFKSDYDKIRSAEHWLNKELRSNMYVSLNEFYYELGLRPIDIGDDLGWNIHKEEEVDISYSSQLAEDGTPCLVINYSVSPRYEYSHLH